MYSKLVDIPTFIIGRWVLVGRWIDPWALGVWAAITRRRGVRVKNRHTLFLSSLQALQLSYSKLVGIPTFILGRWVFGRWVFGRWVLLGRWVFGSR